MPYPGIWGTDSISTFTSLNTCVLNKCVIVSYIKNYNAITACLRNLVEILITKFGFLEQNLAFWSITFQKGVWLWVRFIAFFERGRG